MSASPQADLCAHLLACEHALLDPQVRRDRSRVSALLSDDFQEFGSSGRVWSREDTLNLLATEEYRPVALESFHCVLIAQGIALVTYRSVRTDPASGRRAAALRSSLWIEESGQWRVRFHQGTKSQHAP